MEVDRSEVEEQKLCLWDLKNRSVEQSKWCEIKAQHRFQFVPEGCVS